MGSFCSYFFEEVITLAVLTNAGAGIASGSVACAVYTDDRFTSLDYS